MTKIRRAIGLMSGTSMDGIDAAILKTDGASALRPLNAISLHYDAGFRAQLTGAMIDARDLTNRDHRPGCLAQVEREVTRQHARAVRRLLEQSGMSADQIDVIGFHGQTVLHQPENGLTVQLGDGAELARLTEIDVVHDLRAADMAAGGQGAPLAPIYHAALANLIPQRPVAFVNIGGVGNITFIDDPQVRVGGAVQGRRGGGAVQERRAGGAVQDNTTGAVQLRQQATIIAFDTGPGNALIDDWALKHLGEPLDRDGALAARGTVDERALEELLAHKYFALRAPKSLDRNAFSLDPVLNLSAPDGAATLTAFTAQTLADAAKLLPRAPTQWVICGGGRNNPTLMGMIAERTGGDVIPAEAIGKDGDHLDGDHLDGDQIEAQCFAYLAVRSIEGLAITFPMTTGVPRPMTGGVFSPAPK